MNGWRAIASAPRDGTNVLLYYPKWSNNPVQIGHYDVTEHLSHGVSTYKSEGWWTWASSSVLLRYGEEKDLYTPSHWMPLPDPPVKGRDD